VFPFSIALKPNAETVGMVPGSSPVDRSLHLRGIFRE
jgi:hypothetical protein